VKEAIARAFRRTAAVDANTLRVSTSDGTVTLDGSVRTWAEHDDAVAAAWAAPGVVAVHDRLTVSF
jgi:osmotically-inducible protein OsmY